MGTVFVGLAGLWLAHSYRRQARLKLAERQVDAYLRLWQVIAPASTVRTTPLDASERQRLFERMSRWYFEDGDGVYVSAAARNLYVAVRTNLVCPAASLQPTALADHVAALPEADSEKRRGCASLRQMSLLRTQLKADLAMHFGFTHYSELRREDREFLRHCGLRLWRQPWRRGWDRKAGRSAPFRAFAATAIQSKTAHVGPCDQVGARNGLRLRSARSARPVSK